MCLAYLLIILIVLIHISDHRIPSVHKSLEKHLSREIVSTRQRNKMLNKISLQNILLKFLLLFAPLLSERVLDFAQIVLKALLVGVLIFEHKPNLKKLIIEIVGRLKESDVDSVRYFRGQI